MGIVGLIWMLIGHVRNVKIKYFLLYNIVQSILISVFLAIIQLGLNIILSIISKISFLDFIAAIINFIFSIKIIRLYSLNISFTAIQLLVFMLIVYIVIGIILGRIFYIPYLSDLMNKAMKSYQ